VSTPQKPNTPPPAKAPPKAAKRASAAVDVESLTPAKPEGYAPVGEVVVLAEANGVRVVADEVRTWKELKE
jgi:hypothetical protein